MGTVLTRFIAEDVVAEAIVDILSDGVYRKYADPQHAFRSLRAAMGNQRPVVQAPRRAPIGSTDHPRRMTMTAGAM